ncbi:hypothetical protein [Streptomyces sp. 8N706]|uniref:hypothetical protein n=1 Tax=Streptomyces sp. 8N706 TaxID=3457416 RepID=UPI003FD544A1
MTETTLEQAITFILNEADEDGVEKVFNAGNQRMKTLRTIRAAAVTEGAKVRIHGIKPKKWEGLEGEVKRIENKRTRINVTLLLTKESTEELRLRGHWIPGDEERYEATGIPASACKVL